jgi:hypothetical protein
MTPLASAPAPATPPPATPPQPPRLLDQLRQSAARRGHGPATIQAFVAWSTRFILFHQKRPPRDLSVSDIGRFLDHVAR